MCLTHRVGDKASEYVMQVGLKVEAVSAEELSTAKEAAAAAQVALQ